MSDIEVDRQIEDIDEEAELKNSNKRIEIITKLKSIKYLTENTGYQIDSVPPEILNKISEVINSDVQEFYSLEKKQLAANKEVSYLQNDIKRQKEVISKLEEKTADSNSQNIKETQNEKEKLSFLKEQYKLHKSNLNDKLKVVGDLNNEIDIKKNEINQKVFNHLKLERIGMEHRTFEVNAIPYSNFGEEKSSKLKYKEAKKEGILVINEDGKIKTFFKSIVNKIKEKFVAKETDQYVFTLYNEIQEETTSREIDKINDLCYSNFDIEIKDMETVAATQINENKEVEVNVK